jgi:hypothetical protein
MHVDEYLQSVEETVKDFKNLITHFSSSYDTVDGFIAVSLQ